MSLTLNIIRSTIARHKFFLVAGLVIITLLTVILIQQLIRVSKPTYTPPPASQQPVVSGKLDISAPTVQQSKTFLETIKPKLPHKQTITTSTGSKVAFVIFTKDPDPYDLYIQIANIDFSTPKSEPNFAQTIQDFRDTADVIFSFLATNDINPSALYIIWGDTLANQKTAESWLNVSGEFPKVVKQNGKYIFENSK